MAVSKNGTDNHGLCGHLSTCLIQHQNPAHSCLSLVDYMKVYFHRLGFVFRYRTIPCYTDYAQSSESPPIMLLVDLSSEHDSFTCLLNPTDYPYMFKPLLSVQEIIESGGLSIMYHRPAEHNMKDYWIAHYPVTQCDPDPSKAHGRSMADAVHAVVLVQYMRKA